MRHVIEFTGFTAGLFIVLMAVAPATGVFAMETLEFEDSEIRIEANSSDGDAGLQIFVDGEPWQRLRVIGPGNRLVYSVNNRGRLRGLGSTEFFTESNEPNYDDVPLPEILEFLPEGEYEFKGVTVEGQMIEGEAELTHDLPCGPEIIFPMDGDVVDPADPLVIGWMPVTNKIDTESETGECGDETDIEIEHYELIIEIVDSEPEQKLTVILPGNMTSYLVSPDFIVPGAEYKYEVIVREESGNQTITETLFSVSD